MQDADLPKVVAVHIEAFPDSFLTLLGHGILTLIYRDFAQSGFAFAFVEGDDICGFLAGTFTTAKNFYIHLVRRYPVQISLNLVTATIRKPALLKAILKRAIELFRKGSKVLERERIPNDYQTIVESSGNVFHALTIAVSPRHRRKGIASKLWSHALQQLPAQGANAIVGSVLGENDPTNGLYVKKGFKLIARLPRQEGGDELKWLFYQRGQCTVLGDGNVIWNLDEREG